MLPWRPARSVVAGAAALLLATAACTGEEPIPAVSPTTAPSPTAEPKGTAVPSSGPISFPTSTAAPVTTPRPTPLPTRSPTPAPSPMQTGTAAPTIPYTSEALGFSFAYPAEWTLDEANPQLVVAIDGLRTASITVLVHVLAAVTSVDEFTQMALDDLRQAESFELLSSASASVAGVPGFETTFISTPSGSVPVRARMLTVVSGRLGFAVSLSAHESQTRLFEPLFDAVADSFSFPDSHFEPPATTAANPRMATGVDSAADEPLGVGTVFEASVASLYAFVDVRFAPLGSEMGFVWLQVEPDGSPTGLLARHAEFVSGSSPMWVWIEPSEPLPLGFYFVVVFINEELAVTIPFTIVQEHGNEFADASSYADWALFLFGAADHERAVYAATRAIELEPDLTDAYLHRVAAYQAQCALDRALADMDAVIALKPDDADLLLSRGSIHWLRNDFDKALADMGRAIEIDPENALVFNNRALVHAAAGNLDDARSDAGTALDLDPGSVAILDTRAYVSLKMGRYDKAAEDYERAAELGFPTESSYYLLGTGLAQAGLGEVEAALVLLRAGLDLVAEEECPDPQLADLIALAQERVGELG